MGSPGQSSAKTVLEYFGADFLWETEVVWGSGRRGYTYSNMNLHDCMAPFYHVFLWVFNNKNRFIMFPWSCKPR